MNVANSYIIVYLKFYFISKCEGKGEPNFIPAAYIYQGYKGIGHWKKNVCIFLIIKIEKFRQCNETINQPTKQKYLKFLSQLIRENV